jgi:hypothetical protein
VTLSIPPSLGSAGDPGWPESCEDAWYQDQVSGEPPGRKGGREALALTTNSCSSEGWNDSKRSAPQKPVAATAADSSLKVGRTWNSFLYLARKNLSFFCTWALELRM